MANVAYTVLIPSEDGSRLETLITRLAENWEPERLTPEEIKTANKLLHSKSSAISGVAAANAYLLSLNKNSRRPNRSNTIARYVREGIERDLVRLEVASKKPEPKVKFTPTTRKPEPDPTPEEEEKALKKWRKTYTEDLEKEKP